jgi:hypothetical protein
MLRLHLEDTRHTEIELLAATFHKRPVSVTSVIGGKLRALLDDQTAPSPDRISDLLVQLEMHEPTN